MTLIYGTIVVSMVLAMAKIMAAAAQPAAQEPSRTSVEVLYFLDNNPAGADIVAVPAIFSKDAGHQDPVRTSTGGKGRLGRDATGGAQGPDGLFSQGAVTVADNYLFTVNAGSNTLSMFKINPEDPLHPCLVGEPADTLGEFPMSVAYSTALKTACVLNGGLAGGVTCFSVDLHDGLTTLDKHSRSLYNTLNQTGTPIGPPGTTSDILFSPNADFLLATVKGVPPAPGSILIWPVSNGTVSHEAVVTHFDDTLLDFGSVFLGSNNRILVADPSFGASIVDVSATLDITEEIHIAFSNFTAPCWATYSEETRLGYVMDAGKTHITAVDAESGAVVEDIPFNRSALGAFDGVTHGTRLYALTGVAAIAMIELGSGKLGAKQIEQIDLSSLGSRMDWQGLAIYGGDAH